MLDHPKCDFIVFAMGIIQMISHDHQAPFWLVLVVLLGNQVVTRGENKLSHAQYTMEPIFFFFFYRFSPSSTLKIAPNHSKFLQTASKHVKLLHIPPYCSKLPQSAIKMDLNGSKWLQMALNGSKKLQEGYHSLERDVFFRIQRRHGHLDNKISRKYK